MTTPAAETRLERWRCPTCGHTLARLSLAPGSIVEVKCKCNTTSTKEVALR